MTTNTETKSPSASTAPAQLVNWFEIPVSNMTKSKALYEAMLDTKLELSDFGGIPHAVISNSDHTCVSGSLIVDPKRPPKRGSSTVIYLNAADGVERCLSRALEAGAKVVQPVTSIGEHGTIALIEDLDGNVVGLHANPKA